MKTNGEKLVDHPASELELRPGPAMDFRELVQSVSNFQYPRIELWSAEEGAVRVFSCQFMSLCQSTPIFAK